MKKNDKPIQFELLFDCPSIALWNALTRPEEMRIWFFDNIPDFKAEKGFKTIFEVESGERTFTHVWKVDEVMHGETISYFWEYAEYSGLAKVKFHIVGGESKVYLKFSLEVLDDFVDDIPEFTRESCEQGWNYFLKERLVKYLI